MAPEPHSAGRSWLETRLDETRTDLAEIKGMLNASLQGHETRISTLESQVTTLTDRVHNANQRMSSIENGISASVSDRAEIRKQLADMEDRLRTQFTRTLQIVVSIVAVIGGIIGIIQVIRITGV